MVYRVRPGLAPRLPQTAVLPEPIGRWPRFSHSDRLLGRQIRTSGAFADSSRPVRAEESLQRTKVGYGAVRLESGIRSPSVVIRVGNLSAQERSVVPWVESIA